ncbi:MAG: tRNA pseudouridine(55) synthase TruB [Chthonomonadales bacterium]
MDPEAAHALSSVDSRPPCGVLVVDKPGGITSHDVVGRIRRIFRTKRVGHTGTLDPLASGVLVICLGQATRIAEYLSGDSKEYIAGIEFGITTDSQDITGQVLTQRDASQITLADVEKALLGFRGATRQIPPMVSAIHHNGQRLYDLARQGIEVDREARPVTFHEIELLNFTPGERGTAEIRVRCSAGAYIRTLAHDIGRTVGSGATMTSLRRISAGTFTIDQAVAFDQLKKDADAGIERERLLSIRGALPNWPIRHLNAEEEVRIQHGMKIYAGDMAGEGSTALLISSAGYEYALAELTEGELQPFKVFPTAEMVPA